MPFIFTSVHRENLDAQRYSMVDGVYPLRVSDAGTPVEKLCLVTQLALKKRGLCF